MNKRLTINVITTECLMKQIKVLPQPDTWIYIKPFPGESKIDCMVCK